MTRNPVIPENTNKRKFLVIQQLNLTIIDLAVFVLFCGIGVGLCLYFWNLGPAFRIIGILIAAIFIVIGFLLNTKSQTHNKKIYAVIFEGIIFIFINKKYDINSKNSTVNLIPYEKIEDEYIYLKSQKYMNIIKIEGNAFFDYEEIKRDDILEKIWEIYRTIDSGKFGATLIKLDELKSRKDTLFFLEEKRHEWERKRKNNEINDKQYFSRIRLLEMEVEKYSNPDISKVFEWIEKSTYIAFYSEDIENLKLIENDIIHKFKRANLNAYKLDIIRKINVLNKIIDFDIADDNENNIYKYKDNLEDYFSYDQLENRASYLNIDKNLKISIGSVENYSNNPGCGWIGQIFNTDSPVIINFKKVNEKVFQESLAKARRTAIATANATSKKEILTQRKREQEVQNLDEFADIIGYGHDELYKFNIYVINKGLNNKMLKESIKETKNTLKIQGLKLFSNPYKQIEAFSGMLPKPNDPLMDINGREAPLYSLVWGMPYINNSLNDFQGWFIGTSLMKDELFLNSHIRNDERRNANMFFTATSGAGKSTTMQRMLKNEVLNGNKVYIIDPENEYSKFADYFGESKIFLGDGIYKINPMQIMPSLADIMNEEEKEKIDYNKNFWNINKDHLIDKNMNLNEALILNHQSIIEILFKTFFIDINEEDIRYLKNKFWFFYNYWLEKLNNKNILEWKNNDFPILQDFYKWLLDAGDKENLNLHNRLIELFEDGFVESLRENKKGTYSMYYNGYTSIDIANNYLTIFDMSSLKDGSDNRLFAMQMFLVIKLLERQIKVNYGLNPNTAQRVIVDEAHLLMDKDFPIALNFIFRMVKMIRKRNGGITIITQNPEDFLSTPDIEKKTKAIINNSQYAFIMQATENNINKIEELYSDSDGFTDQEKRDLVTASKGTGLLITSKSRRFTLKMDVQKEDFRIISGDESVLKSWVLNYLTTRLFNLINGLKYIDITFDKPIFLENESEEKTLHIHLKENHNLNVDLFKNNIEIQEVILEDNMLMFNFKNLHKEIAIKFFDKVAKKLELIREKQEGSLKENDKADTESY